MTFFTGRVFPLRLASPLIGGRGLYKRKRTLWHKLLSKKSKSVDLEFAFAKINPTKRNGRPGPSTRYPPAGGIRAAVNAGQAAEPEDEQAK